MKIIGLHVAKFDEALAKADSDLKFNMDDGPGLASAYAVPGPIALPIQGYLFYKSTSQSVWKAHNSAGPLNKPCVHMVYEVVKLCLAAGASSVWAEKIKFKLKDTLGELHVQQLALAFKAKGLTCQCPVGSSTIAKAKQLADAGAVNVPSSSSPPKKSYSTGITYGKKPKPYCSIPKKTKPSVPAPAPQPGHELDAPALVGSPITVCEQEWGKGLPSRSIYAAACGLYVLFELDRAIDGWVRESTANTRVPSASYYRTPMDVYREVTIEREDWRTVSTLEEFKTFKTEYEYRFARNMFDFLVLASFGEAVHHSALQWPGGRPSGESEACAQGVRYDPRQSIPVLERVFRDLPGWSAGYGGRRWARIAFSAGYYIGEMRKFPLVFADHTVDLAHNGGLAFNKGYIFKNPTNLSSFTYMLQVKSEATLLANDYNFEISEHVRPWIYRIQQLLGHLPVDYSQEFVPFDGEWRLGVKAHFKSVEDPIVPLIQWGEKPWKVEVSSVTPKPPQEDTYADLNKKAKVSKPEHSKPGIEQQTTQISGGASGAAILL